MRIGIIGAGHIGGTTARLFVDAVHEVAIGNSRGPETLRELVAELGPSAVREADPELGCNGRKLFVSGPKLRALGQQNRGEQMHVDRPDSLSHQPVPLDEPERFLIGGNDADGEIRKKIEDLPSLSRLAAGKLPDDKWMRHDILIFERFRQPGNALVQMVDPDRCVDENQEERRRRGAFASGSLPLRRARRRALSRAIRARSPSWTSAVRSCIPVTRCACSINCSSRLMVVRILIPDASTIHQVMHLATPVDERTNDHTPSSFLVQHAQELVVHEEPIAPFPGELPHDAHRNKQLNRRGSGGKRQTGRAADCGQ